jgi:membrane protein implicated in regulation of membrane protease activity
MTALYVVFLIVGLTIFAISALGIFDHSLEFGHGFEIGHGMDMTQDFDLGHQTVETHTDSPGLFSIRTISAFLAGFGVAGICAKLGFGWGVGLQLLSGFVMAFAFAALAYGIMKVMYNQQGGSVLDTKTLVGKNAVVTVGTGDQGIGECRVDNNHYTCREKNNAKLLPNQIGKIVIAEPGLLIVEKL